ncbi:hypothetical protein C5167_008551, partial [Papaver somniferum]
MMDILTPVDVPQIIQSFFALEGVNCHDGHTKPLLGVQVTELLDGIFVGCSFNHVIGDGTSFWKLFNALAETNRKLRKASKEAVDQHIECSISSLPITKRWFMEDPTLINLPFSHHKEFIERYERPLLRERMFHFTEESLAKLKAKSNEECGIKKYFCGTTTVGELLEHGIGWEAMLLHEAVEEYTDEKIRVSREEWMKKPYILQMGPSLDAASVMMGGSPKFDVYGCDFGLGMAVAARSGSANKFDGKVTAYRGLTGIRSVMLEICLPPQSISALESDAEFMDAVSPHETHSEVLGVNNGNLPYLLGFWDYELAELVTDLAVWLLIPGGFIALTGNFSSIRAMFENWWQVHKQQTGNTNWLHMTMTVCWFLWNTRCEVQNQNVKEDPQGVARKVLSFTSYWENLNTKRIANKTASFITNHHNSQWIPHIFPFLKLNCDASYDPNIGLTGIALVLRDHT